MFLNKVTNRSADTKSHDPPPDTLVGKSWAETPSGSQQLRPPLFRRIKSFQASVFSAHLLPTVKHFHKVWSKIFPPAMQHLDMCLLRISLSPVVKAVQLEEVKLTPSHLLLENRQVCMHPPPICCQSDGAQPCWRQIIFLWQCAPGPHPTITTALLPPAFLATFSLSSICVSALMKWGLGSLRWSANSQSFNLASFSCLCKNYV